VSPRVAAAQISHETNRFSVVPTDYAAFEASGLTVDDAIRPSLWGSNSEFGGFLAGAEHHGFDLRRSSPSGRPRPVSSPPRRSDG
jgi:microcystin degradation protein MlrC